MEQGKATLQVHRSGFKMLFNVFMIGYLDLEFAPRCTISDILSGVPML